MRSAAALIISAAPSSKSRSAPASASSACGRPSSSMSAPCGACARPALLDIPPGDPRLFTPMLDANGGSSAPTTPRRRRSRRSRRPAPARPARSSANRRRSSPFREVFLGDSPSPRLSIGFGVNWNSPFGPFRIDIARALLHQRGRRHQALHLQRRDCILMNKYLLQLGARRARARRSGRRSGAAAAAPRSSPWSISTQIIDARRCTPCAAANAQIQAQVTAAPAARVQQLQTPAPDREAGAAGRGQRAAAGPAARRGARSPDPDLPGDAAEQPERELATRRERIQRNHRLCAPADRPAHAAGCSATIMQQRGADLVVDAPPALSAAPALDVTAAVLAIMNQNATPLNVNAPAAAAPAPAPARPRRPRRRRRRRGRARRAADGAKSGSAAIGPARRPAGDGGAAASLSHAPRRSGRGAGGRRADRRHQGGDDQRRLLPGPFPGPADHARAC